MKKRALICSDFEPGFHYFLNGTQDEMVHIFNEVFDSVHVTDDFFSKTIADFTKYDCLILYNVPLFGAKRSDNAFTGLIDYVVNGGSIIVIHIISPGAIDEGAQVFGGRFRMHPPYNRYRIEPADVSHPILEGIEPFEIDDELHQLYTEEFIEKTILLNCVNDDGRICARGPIPHQDIYAKNGGIKVPIAWCHEFGKGRIIYTCPGHNAESFKNPEYRKFLKRCGKWLLRKL